MNGVLVLRSLTKFLLIMLLAAPLTVLAEPLAGPGDTWLRHDIQLLNDTGTINIPLTTWPMSLGRLDAALDKVDARDLDVLQQEALDRLRDYLAWELDVGMTNYRVGLAAASNPRVIRTFQETPREDVEVSAGLSWFGERFAVKLAAAYVDDPFDGEEFRPDGTYVGVALGNWMLTAGWQDRWWGPGYEGSMILGTNARPTPGITLQRNLSTAFKSKWLSWLGPWTFMTFMSELDDERTINDALLFGVRGSFRPPGTGLEIGISRTGQWCGDDRPCDAGTFYDLLVGNDNRGVNVDPDDEPGNQIGGFDIRWTLPKQFPMALYMQWVGEDGSERSFPSLPIGSWLRQLGVEHWGSIAGVAHRTHLEVSESICREGGFGFSNKKPNCAYDHSIYTTGYRYRGRSIGHPGDGDTLSYSIGSTLVQSAGPVWDVQLRYMEVNRVGSPNPRHTLSQTALDVVDVQVSHDRMTRFGRFRAGVGYSRAEDQATASSSSDAFGFVQWSSN